MNENELAKCVVDCCYRIHKTLGSGLLESVYEEVLAYELTKACLSYQRQQWIAVCYDGQILPNGFRADIVVEGKLILELKSVEAVVPVHQKQLLTYLRLTDLKLGLLINFNSALIKDGIQRVVNGLGA